MRLAARLIAVLVTILSFASLPGASQAATVNCGDAITQSTTLDSDLNCSGNGITIGADNVTLDLGGHTITGQGTGNGVTDLPPPDEPPFARRKGIEIRNGVIRNFSLNVYLNTVQGAVVHDLTSDGGNGISCYQGDCTIEHTQVMGGAIGFNHHLSPSYAIDNVVRGNGIGIGRGPVPAGMIVRGNVVEGGGDGISEVHAGATIEGNRISGTRFNAISLSSGGGPISHNAITGNLGVGINVEAGTNAAISDNVISDNGSTGILFSSAFAFGTIDRNLIVRNGGSGVSVRESAARVTGNTVSENALDGVLIGISNRDSAATVVEGNNADRNGGDGIHSLSSFPSLTGNHTWFNGNLGIEAVPGTSGGGNWAKHNGNLAQCVPASLCSTTGKPKS